MASSKKPGTSGVPDGGWGWVAVLGGFIYMMIVPAINRCFSLINTSWQHLFSASPQATSGAFSLYCVLSTVSGPLCSFLVERFGCRVTSMLGGVFVTIGLLGSGLAPKLYVVYITFGVFVGLGRGIVEVGKEVCFASWFDRNRSKASGFSAVAAGVGTLGLAPVIQICIDEFGALGAMLVLAGFAAHIVFAGVLMRAPFAWELKSMEKSNVSNKETAENGIMYSKAKDDEEDCISGKLDALVDEDKIESNSLAAAETADETGGSAGKELDLSKVSVDTEDNSRGLLCVLLRNSSFAAYCFMMATCVGGSGLVNSHFASFSLERGITLHTSSYMISATGVVLIICRFTTGIIFDVPAVRAWRKEIMGLHGVVMGAALVLMVYSPGKWGLIVNFFIYIIAQSVFGIQYGVILSDIIPKKDYVWALGILRFGRGFGYLLGPLVGGLLKDVTHSYDMSFLFGGLLVIFPAAVFFITMIYHRRNVSRGGDHIAA